MSKILVIGGGGREHAIVKTLKKSKDVTELLCLPGNGGIAKDARCLGGSAKDIPALVEAAKREAVDYCVVAPDDPLALGAVDALTEAGIPCFGPTKAAARIESSKVFSKQLMKKYGIPTAPFEVFDSEAAALAYLDSAAAPIVVKADGLALGKGVTVAATIEEAKAAVHAIMGERIFGESGARILIEQCLEGPEVSVLAFADGERALPMVSAMDHKRALDDDQGPNTGGMGAVAPNPLFTKELLETCRKTIFEPTMAAMKAEGCPFKGCLYVGLMLTKDGPQVIEYNCRFGDPETQVVLPLFDGDLYAVMRACTEGRLDSVEVKFKDAHACCVVLASDGYPGKYETGYRITLPAESEGRFITVAGARAEGQELATAGGRVLGVTAVAPTLKEAVEAAYQAADEADFNNKYCRRDIGARALRG